MDKDARLAHFLQIQTTMNNFRYLAILSIIFVSSAAAATTLYYDLKVTSVSGSNIDLPIGTLIRGEITYSMEAVDIDPSPTRGYYWSSGNFSMDFPWGKVTQSSTAIVYIQNDFLFGSQLVDGFSIIMNPFGPYPAPSNLILDLYSIGDSTPIPNPPVTDIVSDALPSTPPSLDSFSYRQGFMTFMHGNQLSTTVWAEVTKLTTTPHAVPDSGLSSVFLGASFVSLVFIQRKRMQS